MLTFSALNSSQPTPKDPPFISKDTIETLLSTAKAMQAKDFAKAAEIIDQNPEILDNTIQVGSLYPIIITYRTLSEKENSNEGKLSAFLNSKGLMERHILDIAAEFGSPEFIENVLQKFLKRQNIPMPIYSLIESCVKNSETDNTQVPSCLLDTKWLTSAKNPLAVAAAEGKLKVVKTIVEFVKKYYKERGLPVPSSFFHSGFVGSVNNGKILALAVTTVETPSITNAIQTGVPGIAVPTIKQHKTAAHLTYVHGGALLLALAYGHKDVAQYLINEGALDETPRQTKYGLLPGDGYLPIAFYTIPQAIGAKPIQKSCTVDLAKYAREAGLTIPVSTTDLERLSRAVKNNDLAKVKKIVLANKELVLNKDREGILPIEWAGNKLEIAQFLKEQGSAVPESLLYYAFGSGSLPVAKWLVEELKMDPKTQLDKLIDVARRNGQEHMIQYLGELGLKV